jgi:hypothetical protein
VNEKCVYALKWDNIRPESLGADMNKLYEMFGNRNLKRGAEYGISNIEE